MFKSIAVTAIVAAGVAQPSAGAASTPNWGEKPSLLVEQYVDVLPELDVNVVFAPGSAPGRVTFYVPSGLDLYPQRSAGSIVGSALVYVADFSAGTSRSVLEGNIVAGPVAGSGTDGCAVGTPTAVWTLRLSALGLPIDLPMLLTPAGSDAPAGAAWRLDLCVPAVAGTGGSVLPMSAMILALTGVELPRAHGVYVWRAVVTPTAPDLRTQLPDRAYELRAVIPVPHRLTLAGRYDSAKHLAVLTGRLVGAGAARPNVKVAVVRLVRYVTPGGAVFRDSVAGTTRTRNDGRFTFRARLGKTAGFQVYTNEVVGGCEAPAFAPGGCSTSTTAGLVSETITISVPPKAKRR